MTYAPAAIERRALPYRGTGWGLCLWCPGTALAGCV